jgi:SulP family sulfate permease
VTARRSREEHLAMAVSSAGFKRGINSKAIGTALTDVFAGAVCSILSIAYCLSYAALIFTGPIAHFLSYGVAVTFLSAAVAGAVVALRSSLFFAVAGPDSSISVIIAAMVATLVRRMAAGGRTDLLEPTLIVMALVTALTGIVLCILGVARAGRAIRFVPFPVIGGFLGATGWLMITGAIQVVTDRAPTIATLGSYADLGTAGKIAAALVVAAALHFVTRRSKSPFVLPGLLLAAFAAAYVALLLVGASPSTAQAAGWMFKPQPAAALALPWKAGAFAGFSWNLVPALGGDLLAILFVTISTLLLNTTGIEIATRREANIDRDLQVLGFANILTAALGGYVSCTSWSRSVLLRTAGASTRLAGLTVAAISAAMIVVDPGFLGYVPKYALGGLLIFLGWGLVYQWLIVSWRQLPLLEYLSLVAITLLIINWGFVAGVLIGVVIGCATFALSASRVNAIKFNFDSTEYRSSLDRGSDEQAVLRAHGRQIQGMALQSYLFFGSANRVYQHVKALLAQQRDCRFLIFDFRRVTGVDSSATQSFAQIKQAAANAGATIVLADLAPEVERLFRAAQFISDEIVVVPDLDRALETCEQKIVELHQAPDRDSPTFHAWLGEALGEPRLGERLAEYCRRLDIKAGEVIARQGEPATSMHFILAGRVGITAQAPEGRTTRLRSLGQHTTVGEMGLLSRQPRSATIVAETASVLYELDTEAFERLRREHPELSEALLGYVLTVMAERLSFANRAIGVLQR